MGTLIVPGAWCRQRRCREGENAEHRLGDGCSCHGHGEAPSDADGCPVCAIDEDMPLAVRYRSYQNGFVEPIWRNVREMVLVDVAMAS